MTLLTIESTMKDIRVREMAKINNNGFLDRDDQLLIRNLCHDEMDSQTHQFESNVKKRARLIRKGK